MNQFSVFASLQYIARQELVRIRSLFISSLQHVAGQEV